MLVRYKYRWNCGKLYYTALIPIVANPKKILNSIETDNFQNIAAGKEYSVTCKPGFQLVGNSVIKCLGFGNWNHDFPVCHLSNMTYLMPNILLNLSLIVDNTQKFEFKETFYALEGSKIRFSCNESENIRYKLIGSEQQIFNFGKWSGNIPNCIVKRHAKWKHTSVYHVIW